MEIGIVGAGMIGATLARALVGSGHRVRLANARGPDTIAALATEMGATAVMAAEAVKQAELVIVSIPQGAVQALPQNLFDGVAAGTIVINIGNHYLGMRDPRIDAIEAGMAESVWVAQRLKQPMVKAFNSIGFPSPRTGTTRPVHRADAGSIRQRGTADLVALGRSIYGAV